jgi:hypothetical protein
MRSKHDTMVGGTRMTPADEAHNLANRKIGDFDRLPPEETPPAPGPTFAQILSGYPLPAVETGTWTLEKGYQRDETRQELIAKVQQARASAPRRAWLPGQSHE